MKKKLRDVLKREWYGQAAPGTPLNAHAAILSNNVMKENLGFYYEKFFVVFKDDYCKLNYYMNDLKRLAKMICSEISKDRDYFKKARIVYDRHMRKMSGLYRRIDVTNLDRASDEELIDLAKEACEAVGYSVGVAHIIEPYALTMDMKIKENLGRHVKDKSDINKVFTLFMSPVKKSFLNEQEEHLLRISAEKDDARREKLIQEHLKRFYWIRNGYGGRHKLTREDIIEQLGSVKENKPDFSSIIRQKNKMIEELGLDKNTIDLIHDTEFLIDWQDERKKNILISVDYLERMTEALSARFDVDVPVLRYMVYDELSHDNLKSKEFIERLRIRKKGCVMVESEKGVSIYSGKDYLEFAAVFEKSKEGEVREINGVTASVGTVIGRVKVCTDLKSINDFKEGYVLVASMTRPEYVPAMKKAVAIITDEGGVTCHAAIVSRELGIPCIIGTKIATKALKDDDLVEIKGNHGLVIILERAKNGGQE